MGILVAYPSSALDVKYFNILEFSVKSGKDSTSTLSFVINRVRFQKNLARKVHSKERQGETSEFHHVFLFS
jgi:hypothetical protein